MTDEIITNKFEDTVYYRDGKLHRDNDLPASIHKDGTEQWWVSGRRHRECNLPAYIYPDGSGIWYFNGKLHRTNGPAATYADGDWRWFIDGKQYSLNKEYQRDAGLSDEDMLVMILKYGNVK